MKRFNAYLVDSDKLKKKRLEKKYTQKQLAELSGVSEISIRKYENNQRTPKIETLTKLAKALNTPLEYFYKINFTKDMVNSILHNNAVDEFEWTLLDELEIYGIKININIGESTATIQLTETYNSFWIKDLKEGDTITVPFIKLQKILDTAVYFLVNSISELLKEGETH